MSYPLYTISQHRNGYVRVKVEDDEGKPTWQARSRRNWDLSRGDKDPIVKNDQVHDKIYHLDGDRTNDDPSNLVKIRFNVKKFVFLKEAKVWFPTKRMKHNEFLKVKM